MPRVTLAQVAAQAGVSKGAASKAMNGRGDVSATTRERVSIAARQLGYHHRSPVGSSAAPMVPGDAPAGVWVTFDTLSNPYSGMILDAVLDEAELLDAVVTVARWGSPDLHAGPQWLRRAHERGAQALVLVTTPVREGDVATCAALDMPLVIVDPATPAPPGAMSVGATNWRGGMQATEHLLELGHRRIAFVGAPPRSTPGRERLAGYRSALLHAAVPFDERLVVPGTFHSDDAEAATHLLSGSDRVTAVFAASDPVALGVINVARRLGLRVPHDLSVVGFDDTHAAKTASPPLTTVRQPLSEMGRFALRAAVARVRDRRAPIPPVELATVLVCRDSTAAPPRM